MNKALYTVGELWDVFNCNGIMKYETFFFSGLSGVKGMILKILMKPNPISATIHTQSIYFLIL